MACGPGRGTIRARPGVPGLRAYNPGTVTGRPPVVLDYESFQQPPTAALPRLPDGRAARAAVLRGGLGRRRPSSAPRDRSAGRLAGRGGRWRTPLAAQQEARGAAAAAARAARSPRRAPSPSSPASRPVLFGGPLFVLYKALAALKPRLVPGSAARPARGPGLLGRLRRPRLRRGPLGLRARRGGPHPDAALRARPRARRPAGLAHRPRRDDRAAWSAELGSAACPRACTATRSLELVAALLPPGRHAGGGVRPLPLVAAARPGRARPVGPRAQGAHGARAVPRARRGLAHVARWPRRRASGCWRPATTSRCRCGRGS